MSNSHDGVLELRGWCSWCVTKLLLESLLAMERISGPGSLWTSFSLLTRARQRRRRGWHGRVGRGWRRNQARAAAPWWSGGQGGRRGSWTAQGRGRGEEQWPEVVVRAGGKRSALRWRSSERRRTGAASKREDGEVGSRKRRSRWSTGSGSPNGGGTGVRRGRRWGSSVEARRAAWSGRERGRWRVGSGGGLALTSEGSSEEAAALRFLEDAVVGGMRWRWGKRGSIGREGWGKSPVRRIERKNRRIEGADQRIEEKKRSPLRLEIAGIEEGREGREQARSIELALIPLVRIPMDPGELGSHEQGF